MIAEKKWLREDLKTFFRSQGYQETEDRFLLPDVFVIDDRNRVEMPGLVTLIPRVIRSVGEVAMTAVKTRQVFAQQEIVDRRWNLCLQCPQIAPAKRCAICGCFMGLKVKLSTSSCPDNPPRWTSV